METLETLKSYLPPEEREEFLREGSINSLCLAESHQAGCAGDEETAWAWLSRAELPADALMALKRWEGSQFIRDMGFPTTEADKVYGPGWLEQA
jgi:hypothetical protein